MAAGDPIADAFSSPMVDLLIAEADEPPLETWMRYRDRFAPAVS
jgi:hypothetical protein